MANGYRHWAQGSDPPIVSTYVLNAALKHFNNTDLKSPKISLPGFEHGLLLVVAVCLHPAFLMT
jgi:hypothetical protein